MKLKKELLTFRYCLCFEYDQQRNLDTNARNDAQYSDIIYLVTPYSSEAIQYIFLGRLAISAEREEGERKQKQTGQFWKVRDPDQQALDRAIVLTKRISDYAARTQE
ncbi:MAG: hypothetical protein EZS28_036587 [Streblomastix strix]|uniref:Uncharacterized protein n=1 Tax=Streblomastix strix TaxID=222440 RepID=A0A5J4UAL8_9EUKA|nr:MAG: hypothetical protein EZS28_036587 [Streblomastix strix]